MKFTIPGIPVGKPRMTQRDKWMKRANVTNYWNWAATARLALKRTTKLTLNKPMRLIVDAYFDIPKSRKKLMPGQLHTVKPDGDNILKSVGDALFINDQMIAEQRIVKRWAGIDGARLEITLDEAI